MHLEQLKKILSMDVNKAISLYELANDVQKKTIIELVKQAKFDNVNLDYNLLGELGKLSGINLIDIDGIKNTSSFFTANSSAD